MLADLFVCRERNFSTKQGKEKTLFRIFQLFLFSAKRLRSSLSAVFCPRARGACSLHSIHRAELARKPSKHKRERRGLPALAKKKCCAAMLASAENTCTASLSRARSAASTSASASSARLCRVSIRRKRAEKEEKERGAREMTESKGIVADALRRFDDGGWPKTASEREEGEEKRLTHEHRPFLTFLLRRHTQKKHRSLTQRASPSPPSSASTSAPSATPSSSRTTTPRSPGPRSTTSTPAPPSASRASWSRRAATRARASRSSPRSSASCSRTAPGSTGEGRW